MSEPPKEEDWKRFRELTLELRERYIAKKDHELLEILENRELSETKKFWAAEERLRNEVRILRACLDGHSRSNMVVSMWQMYRHEMLTDEDLADFSNDLGERIRSLVAICDV